jgi:hypothetical protein
VRPGGKTDAVKGQIIRGGDELELVVPAAQELGVVQIHLNAQRLRLVAAKHDKRRYPVIPRSPRKVDAVPEDGRSALKVIVLEDLDRMVGGQADAGDFVVTGRAAHHKGGVTLPGRRVARVDAAS